MKSAFVVMGSALLLSLSVSTGAFAQGAGAGGGRGGFTEQGGEAIFKNVCQGCHMPDAKGAVGAGMYPALAKNPKLEVAGYPVSVIVNGQKAMPALGGMFSDQQVADVTNYIRTHFGNNYKDKVTPADVKAARP
ncbi:MAG: cytochrome c [Alphaproteobacteria bacterium]|nr:cytochrome c [Alphaproteobacteria bacterium]